MEETKQRGTVRIEEVTVHGIGPWQPIIEPVELKNTSVTLSISGGNRNLFGNCGKLQLTHVQVYFPSTDATRGFIIKVNTRGIKTV